MQCERTVFMVPHTIPALGHRNSGGLTKTHLISYLTLDRGKVIKYKIRDWKQHNTVLDYNCPCQKDTGFFFLPLVTATELISSGRCSETDIVLDLWLSTIYNDGQVQGSELGPVVYLRNGTGSPLVTYNELGKRWGISKATAGKVLKKLERLQYLSLMSFPGRTSSVIYLQGYLSTMFQISDVLIDKDEVAMTLNINISLPEEAPLTEEAGNDAAPDIDFTASSEDTAPEPVISTEDQPASTPRIKSKDHCGTYTDIGKPG